MNSHGLHSLTSVRGRFHRSINVVHDWRDGADLTEYIVTPTARDFVDQVLSELDRPKGTRAWSVTGPYGSGKSALALFLADTLASTEPSHSESRALRASHATAERPFLTVRAVAERQPIHSTIAEAFAEAFYQIEPTLSRRFRRLGKSLDSSERLVERVLEAVATAQDHGYGGVLFLLDEMGKFLEFAADNDLDLFVLQQLAEAAARSEIPLVFVSILHTGFADYLPASDDVRRLEWKKVQGRFRDVPFHLPAEQLLGLVGHSLKHSWPPGFEQQWQAVVDRMLAAGEVFAEASRRLDLRTLFYACYPFHPVTALLLWPVFRSKLAQNERSLFAFLTSFEPFGFQEFLRAAAVIEPNDALFRPAELYDYIANALGMAAFRGEHARRWSLIEHALGRMPADAPLGVAEVIKTVGLLGMYGSVVGVRPSLAMLRLIGGADVAKAVQYLQDQSVLLYRRHTDAYALWEGSDVDLESAYQEAVHQSGNQAVAARIQRALEFRPVVARAHYIESGTLRVFRVGVIDASFRALTEALARAPEEDGQILYMVGGAPKEVPALVEQARIQTAGDRHPLTLLAFPRASHGLEDALREFEAWRWVGDHLSALAGDPVARQEVRARLAAAQERFERLAGGIFGLSGHLFEPDLSTWVYGGKLQEFENSLSFQRFLSLVCETQYNGAPPLRNELINRQSLSSATAAARRTLLERAITATDRPRLGIEGNPPEASVYASMLERSGIHTEREVGWSIDRPSDPAWQPAWDAVVHCIERAGQTRLPLLGIYEVLARPPFGMREGPIALLVCLVLIARQDELAIYEDGVFAADFRIELLERLLRRPDTFAVQSLSFTEEQRCALQQLRQLISNSPAASKNDSGREAIVPVVRSLVLNVAQLPPYSRRTKRALQAKHLAVRDALLQARDPRQLLFEDLPKILCAELSDGEAARTFADYLYQSVKALQNTYPALLEQIGQYVRDAFRLSGSDEAVREELQDRIRPLQKYATDRRLKLFLTTVMEAHRHGDWREAVARGVTDGKPPTHWHDVDVTDFQVNLQQVVAELARLTGLVSERERAGVQKVVRIDILGREGEEGEPVIIAMTEQLEREARVIAAQIRDLLAKTGDPNGNGTLRQLRLAALAQAAAGVARDA